MPRLETSECNKLSPPPTSREPPRRGGQVFPLNSGLRVGGGVLDAPCNRTAAWVSYCPVGADSISVRAAFPPAAHLTNQSTMVIIITVLKQTICEVSHLIPVLAFVQHYKKFYTSQFEAAAARHGLNQLEIDILLFLHNNPDCRTASDICRYRGLAKSNVSKAVEHLRVMDLVTVSPAADNRRQRMLGFTPQAAMLVEELAAIQQAANAAVAADLTPTEWQAMQDYIARMDATLRRRLAEKGENV